MRLPPAALLATALAGSASRAAPQELPPREPVAGMHGFRSVSRVVYPARPEAPHVLEVRYQFPARVRWNLSLADGPPDVRVLEYRYGARAYQVLRQRTDSIEIEGRERDRLFGRMALRRAAMLWPDGFRWKDVQVEGGPAKRALLEAPPAAGEPRSLGHVDALHLDDGRPAAFVLHGPDGEEEERLRVRSWQEQGERTWPARLQLVVGRRTIWDEEVRSVSGNAYFLDLSFLPPDRRGEPLGGAAVPEAGVHAVDLRPATFRTHALPAKAGWPAWIARAEELVDEARRELASGSGEAPELDPTPTFALREDGRPSRCLVRLAQPREAPPPGWTSVGERPGLLVAVEALGGAELAASLERLRRAVPAGATAGTPYLRVYAADAAERFQLALPLRPREGGAGESDG